ncbi:STAS domain-containing protein [Dechloromonas sp. ZY10]|uniref:STAS domain-containing protein n=1 Tax=Dechloromonas aquae TaxID=2664436 RepID=UPI003529946F
MIDVLPGRWRVTTPMRMEHAAALLAAGCRALQPGEVIVDLADVADADSSAIAVMLGWLRAAPNSRSTLRFANIPAGVAALADLYGVSELLPRP